MKDSIDFFRDEVRSGFFIPTVMKQAWSAQLLVLDEIDRICKKYGITYFADWGTLLGAVRHGGYVPWDDDLDICMVRDDYVRFKQVALLELPKEFDIHDFEHKENHWLFLSRVVNSKHINFEFEHLEKNHNFQYLAAVDIFVLDYLYEDEEQEKERCSEVKKIIWLADSIVEGKISSVVQESELKAMEEKYEIRIDSDLEPNEIGIALYHLAENQMARAPKNESKQLGQIFPWILLGGKGIDKNEYRKLIRLPFENRWIPVPALYHQILSRRYENYYQIHKVWDGHNYPFFEGQRENLQAVADFKLPEFQYETKMQRNEAARNLEVMSYKEITRETIYELELIHNRLKEALITQNNGDAISCLLRCQEIAIDYGNYIETILGYNDQLVKKVIAPLEQYCESLFITHDLLLNKNANIDTLNLVFSEVKNILTNQIMDRKVALFLTDDPRRWSELETLYKYYDNQDEWEVCVVALPTYRKNPYGEPFLLQDDDVNLLEKRYPSSLQMIPWESYDISIQNPNVVLIQNQYDGENPYLTIPKMFYAENIRQYTDDLIYVMPSGVKEFGVDDKTDMYQLKH